MYQKFFLVLLFLLFVSFEQIVAASSAGSVPDDAFMGKRTKNSRSKMTTHVPNATLGDSSANSLSPPKTKRKKGGSPKDDPATSKQHLRADEPTNPSTELRLATSPTQGGPKKAIKKETLQVIGHARYRKLKPEASYHGSKQQPIEINDHEGIHNHNERTVQIRKVREHASGELMRQIRAAKKGKTKARTNNLPSNDRLPEIKQPGSPSGSGGGGNGKNLDLSLRLRRRGLEKGSEKKSVSTRLQLGSSTNTSRTPMNPQSYSQRQPSHTFQQIDSQQHPVIRGNTSPAGNLVNGAHRNTMNPVGGPIRHAGASTRLIAVYPYHMASVQPSLQQARMINAQQNRMNYGQQTSVATSPRMVAVRTINSANRNVHVQQQATQSPPIATPISPGSQNLIDRVGTSASTSRTYHPVHGNAGNGHHSPVNTNLSLGL